MDKGNHDRISQAAYQLWQKEGSPDGRDQEFWERAEAMVKADQQPAVKTPLQGRTAAEKEVDKAAKDTFPASDPPAFNATTGAGKSRKAATLSPPAATKKGKAEPAPTPVSPVKRKK